MKKQFGTNNDADFINKNARLIELILESFGFKTLKERILAVGKKIDEEKQGSLF